MVVPDPSLGDIGQFACSHAGVAGNSNSELVPTAHTWAVAPSECLDTTQHKILRTKDTAAVVDWRPAHGAERQPRGATGADDEVAAVEEHDAARVGETHDAVLRLGIVVGGATGRFACRCRGSRRDFTSRTLGSKKRT